MEYAASFPEGSIIPYNKSYIVIQKWDFSSADVPIIVLEVGVTFIFISSY
jgi:hypothetical protein